MPDKDKDKELISTLTETMDQISEALNEREVFRIVENLLINLTNSEFATFFIFDNKKQILYSKKEIELVYPMVNPEGLLGKSFLTKKPAIYNHIASEKLYLPTIDNPKNIRLRSQLIVPILHDDNLIAMIRLSRSIYMTKHFTLKEIDITKTLCSFLAKVIKKIEFNEINNKDNNYDSYDIKVNTTKIGKEIKEINKDTHNNEINSTMLFLSNTVHDIRTPANSLYGFLEVLEAQIEDKRLKEFIENAKESASFINKLTDSILEQVKDKHEIQSSRPEIVNTIKFFSQIGDLFSANMCKKEISYLIYICPDIPKEILIDRLKVKRIIINLIGNAYKFTPSKEHIHFEIKCNPEKEELQISIRDTGLGIAKSRQKAIFNSFEQAEEDTNEHFGGTGLGLAISSKYVNDLGGTLELESELDKGSNFYFNLPLKIITSEPSQEQIINFDRKITILTDNLLCINAENIKFYLIKLGIESDNISISKKIETDTTHLFCFQHKVSEEIIHITQENAIKLILVEEQLFSLSKNKSYKDITIISENTYYGHKIHSAVFSGKKLKIILADDSKINLILLRAMLETEYCDIEIATDGQEALEKLEYAYQIEKHPYDMIFLDEHMPNISGTQLLIQFREIEKQENIVPIFAVSVSGDPDMSKQSIDLYNFMMNKPFKKQDVKDAVSALKKDL